MPVDTDFEVTCAKLTLGCLRFYFFIQSSNLGSLVLSDLARANLPRRDDNFDKP